MIPIVIHSPNSFIVTCSVIPKHSDIVFSDVSLSYSPLMPLPSSWKELRCRPEPPPKPASSRCSLPPLPEEAMLLWGERGAWSGAGPLVVRRSSWDSQTWPRGWLLGPLMGGVRDTERFRGLCCWLPPPLVRTAGQQQD